MDLQKKLLCWQPKSMLMGECVTHAFLYVGNGLWLKISTELCWTFKVAKYLHCGYIYYLIFKSPIEFAIFLQNLQYGKIVIIHG